MVIVGATRGPQYTHKKDFTLMFEKNEFGIFFAKKHEKTEL